MGPVSDPKQGRMERFDRFVNLDLGTMCEQML